MYPKTGRYLAEGKEKMLGVGLIRPLFYIYKHAKSIYYMLNTVLPRCQVANQTRDGVVDQRDRTHHRE